MHSHVMAEPIVADKTPSKIEQWRERIAEQGRSGLSVKQFCKERGLAEMLLLRLAETATEHASAFRAGGTTSSGATARGGWRPSGTDIGERRETAHWFRSGWCDTTHGFGSAARMIHLPASVRSIPLPDALRYAQELRRAACAGTRTPRTGCVCRASVCFRQPAARPRQDPILGPRRICGMEQAIGGWDLRGAIRWIGSEECRREITAQELGAMLSGIDLEQADAAQAIPDAPHNRTKACHFDLGSE